MLEKVGRYQVKERIGEGAMADVYRAYDPGIHRTLAVKVLKQEFRQNPQYAARFLREAKAAGALSHPNIVTVYDVGEEDGYPYIVMELLEGEGLDSLLARQGRLPVDVVMEIGVQLAEALRYAHGTGVVHRDIKPSNIYLGKDGRSVKLLDFGIARVTEDAVQNETDAARTQVGQVMGTPRYMSPEQALGQPLDGRSDLFSTGAVLYELICGAKAFDGASPATLALQITQNEPAPISAAQPDCPLGLQFIIGKLLAKRPDRRFSDGRDLAEALRREQGVYQAVLAEARSRKRYVPLQLRLSLGMAAITTVVFLACASVVLHRQYQAMERIALTSGAAIASFVASNAALPAADNASLPVDQQDWLPVQAFIKAAAADDNVREMTVVDASGVVRASSVAARVGHPYHAITREPQVERRQALTVTSAFDGAGFRFVRPIDYAGLQFGKVDVVVSKAGLDAATRLSQLLTALLGVATVGAVIAVAYAAARLLAQPVRRLGAAFEDAIQGHGDFRISHSRKDEFGELFDSFNRYAAMSQERLEAVEARLRSQTSSVRGSPMPLLTEGPFAPSAATETREALEQTRIATLGQANLERTVIRNP